jgi:poly(3-hydroxybutyrate) depolymerase
VPDRGLGASSGWTAFPIRSRGGRATTRARGTAIPDDPPGPLSTMRYEGCADGSEVRMTRIDGLGHAWTHANRQWTFWL